MPHYATEWLNNVIKGHGKSLGRALELVQVIREELAITDEMLRVWIQFDPKKWSKYKVICKELMKDTNNSSFVESSKNYFKPLYLERMKSVLTGI